MPTTAHHGKTITRTRADHPFPASGRLKSSSAFSILVPRVVRTRWLVDEIYRCCWRLRGQLCLSNLAQSVSWQAVGKLGVGCGVEDQVEDRGTIDHSRTCGGGWEVLHARLKLLIDGNARETTLE